MLLLYPNEVVPADRLIDELWGEVSLDRAAADLRVNVSRLRKALAGDVPTTRPPGYVVRILPDQLDLHPQGGTRRIAAACHNDGAE